MTNIHEIGRLADGVMVARGDLGIETNIADLPNVQRRIVHSSARSGRRCIVATHLLESMIDNPIPTRAEVTDVANAIYEGVDAVIAMYHDQGLPVLKHSGFGHAVNVTLGLPIVRTSVDHGTALDLAATGRAEPGSFLAAIELADLLSRSH